MISLLLLLVLAWGFYIGYRRGLLLQVYYLISAMASAFVAGQFYKGLGEQFHLLVPYANPQEGQGTFFFPSDQLFQLDKVFYAGIGYLLVFGIVKAICKTNKVTNMDKIPAETWNNLPPSFLLGIKCNRRPSKRPML